MKSVLRSSLILSALLVPTPSSAQTWQSLSGQISGTPAGSGPQRFTGTSWFAGTTTGDYRSNDGGVTWTNVSGNLLDSSNRIITANHYFKASSGRLFRMGDLATWDNRIGSPVWYSDSNGASWTEVPTPSPSSYPPGIGFTGMTEHQGALYASDQLGQGVWKSTDNGLTWAPARNGIPATLTWPYQATVLSGIASTSQAVFATGPSTGIYRSMDGGANWTAVNNGLSSASARDIVTLDDGTIFAAVQDANIFRSTDQGNTWTNVTQSLGQGSIRSLATDGTRIYAFTSSQNLLESTDGGNSFARINGGTAPAFRGSNARQLSIGGNTLIYSSTTAFFRIDLTSAPRVAIAPAIITQPESKGVNEGATLTLTASHSNATLPITYQWKLGGNIISGATSRTYTVPSASAANAGSYTLEITNGGGTAVSNAATVNVEPATPGHIDYSVQPLSVTGPVHAVARGQDGTLWFGGAFGTVFPNTPGHRLTRLLPDGTRDPAFLPSTTTITTNETPYAMQPLSDGSVLVGGGGTSSQYLRKVLPDGSIDHAFDWPNELGGTTYAIRPGPGDTTYVAGSYGIHRIFNHNGGIDFSFNPPNTGDFVRSFVIAPDGKLIIAGEFNTVNGLQRGRIARLHPDGTLDLTFDTGGTSNNGFNGDLNTIALQKDGSIVATGDFTSYRGTNIARVARILPTGAIDGSFTPPTFVSGNNGRVLTLALDGQDRILLGGAFTQVNGTTRNNIARLNTDGTLDTSFPGRPAAQTINTLHAQPDGNILVGAANTFHLLTGAAPAYPSIRSFPGDVTASPGQQATFTVTLAGPASGAIYEWFKDGQIISGQSSASLVIPSVSTSDAARYHVRVTIGGTVLVSQSSRLNIGGAPYIIHPPSAAPGYLGYRHHLSAQAGGTGPLTYQWYKNGSALSGAANAGYFFPALTAADAGNYFLRITGPGGSTDTPTFYLSVLPRHGTVDPSFRFGFTPTSPTSGSYNTILTLPDGSHLAGGSFSSAATGTRTLFRLFPDGTIDTSFDSSPLDISGTVKWLFRLPDGKIIVGSEFGAIRLNADLTKDDQFSFTNIGTGGGSAIAAMALLSDGRLLVQAGASATVSGHPSKLFRTKVTGAIDPLFAPVSLTPAASVTAISQDTSGRILLGGSFTHVAGQTRNRVARLDAEGVLDPQFAGPGAFATSSGIPRINAITAGADGSVFIGGENITLIGAAPAGRVAKFDAITGAHIPSFFPSSFTGVVHALRVLPDGRLSLAGNITMDAQGNRTVHEVLHPNGARDRRGFGATTGHSAATGPALMMAPSTNGTHILAGTFTDEATSHSYFVRYFTADTELAFSTHPVTATATTPANTVNLNANVTLTSTALGTGAITYQWYLNGEPISGANAATLTRNPVQRAHEGTYTVSATNTSGTVTSRPMYLDVLAEPEISGDISLTYNTSGSTATLTGTAKGAPTLSYAWQKDGVTIANVSGRITGATSTTLVISNLAETDSGAYRLVVTNAHGVTRSTAANIAVTGLAGSIDTSWSSPNPFIDSATDSHPARLLPVPGGSFFIGASYFGFAGVSGTQRYAAQFDATGTRLTGFTHNSVSPLQSYGKIRWAVHPDGILYASANIGSSSAIFRFNSNGTATACGDLAGIIEDIAFDASGRLLIATASISNGNLRRYTVNTTANTFALDATFNQVNTGSIWGLYPSPATGGWYVVGPNVTTANNPGLSNAHATTYIVRVGQDGIIDPTFSHNASGQSGFSSRPFLVEAPGGKVHFRNLRLTSTGARETSGWNETTIPLNAYRGFFQTDGKLIVAGTNTVRRLLDNGTLDPAFSAPVVAGEITDILSTATGHLYAIGNFNATAATNNRVDLIRLNIESPDIGFTTAHTNLTVPTGQAATFTATTYGTGITYKWYHDGMLVANGGRYSGAGTASLTIANTTTGDNGSVRLEISNSAGIRSRTATLTVEPPPAAGFSAWSALLNVPADKRGLLDTPAGDGISNLIKFALGLTPAIPAGSASTAGSTAVSGTAYPTVVFNRRKDIGDVTIEVLAASDLPVIPSIPTQVVSTTDNGDGTETVVVRTNLPVSAASKQFFTIKVTHP
ncbi:immunoglobulin domain-containing protein [Luteolibacter sp. SL250]|uniref:immunoglobulin domain-containing protein n=1 Tax=Luteolibacter sp. SL250 TaxID=2995170 RepID=UPI002270EA2E|nr:immunoglobulin domain-containing protein [Luteolibacter sp. SL250]WAC18562.1 immunoglobulin domain-containing protein [Luteolibacter sp. SL250]